VAIIFFDEFDSIGAKLKDETHDAIKRMVSELKIQIDGFKSSFNTLLIIAATNRPGDIDNSFLRPGRFAQILRIDIPTKEARAVIIGNKLGKYAEYIEEGAVDFDELVEWCDGFNGADIVEFCTRIKTFSADRCIEQYGDNVTGLKIIKKDVDDAKECVKSSVRDEDLAGLKAFEELYSKNLINPKPLGEGGGMPS
jgi:SpoVK/Ycf46/Vps4 family AAA+-type ATPase